MPHNKCYNKKIDFCEKTINNYKNELIYTNYINKNIMYLYLFDYFEPPNNTISHTITCIKHKK